MAVVTVQLGQCGNQLGEELFSRLSTEAHSAQPALSAAIQRTFFSGDGDAHGGSTAQRPPHQWRARAVLVDTEPRVVWRCLSSATDTASTKAQQPWGYDRRSTLWKQGGAGNNWAFGFHHYGPQAEAEVLERVRREAERCHRLDSFLVLQSVAGGTGSGLGSHCLGLLRDAYPATMLTSIAVWPFESGEVSVQSYNAILSVAAAYEYADMVLLCENERYMDICRLAYNEPNPSMSSLNRAMCGTLCHALLPCRSALALGSSVCLLPTLAEHLCAHPLYRLVTARSVPQIARGAEAFTSDSWAALQGRLVHMCETGSLVDRRAPGGGVMGSARRNSSAARAPLPPRSPEGVSSARSAAIEPGSGDVSPAAGGGTSARVAKSEGLPAEAGALKPSGRSVASAAFLWGSGALDAPVDNLRKLPMWRWGLEPLQVHADPHRIGGLDRSLGLLSNCQTVVPTLRATTSRAAAMLHSSMYLHRYESHGVGREEMSEALLAVLQVLNDYSRI